MPCNVSAGRAGRNKLIVIGQLGSKICYLNVALDVAVARYNHAMEAELKHDDPCIQTFQFDDEFDGYDVYEAPKREKPADPKLAHKTYPPLYICDRAGKTLFIDYRADDKESFVNKIENFYSKAYLTPEQEAWVKDVGMEFPFIENYRHYIYHSYPSPIPTHGRQKFSLVFVSEEDAFKFQQRWVQNWLTSKEVIDVIKKHSI